MLTYEHSEHRDEILRASLGKFHDGELEASPSGLLRRVLQLRVDASGRDGAVAQSEVALKHLADLADKEMQAVQAAAPSATDEDMLLSCRVFDILATTAVGDQAQQGASSEDDGVRKVLDGIKSVASDDCSAASAHFHEWGARAINSLLHHHGQSIYICHMIILYV